MDDYQITGQFCKKCGEELLVMDLKHIGYDKHTGERLCRAKYRCPNRKHIFDGHTSYDGTYNIGSDAFDLDFKYFL